MDKLTTDLTNLKNIVNDILAWCQDGETNESAGNLPTLPDSAWVATSVHAASKFHGEVCKPSRNIFSSSKTAPTASSNDVVGRLKKQTANSEKCKASFDDLFDWDEVDEDSSRSPSLLEVDQRRVAGDFCSTPVAKTSETAIATTTLSAGAIGNEMAGNFDETGSDDTEDYVDTADRAGDFDDSYDHIASTPEYLGVAAEEVETSVIDLTAEEKEEMKERLQSVPEDFDVVESTDDFADDFADDFDDSLLQQIEEAEQSYVNDKSDTELEEEAIEEDPQNQPQDPKFSAVLKQYFGYSKFRPMQWRIIDSVLNEKRDNCVVMATGYGKSLCYQFPSVFTGRSTVVISPLISLMQDQVLGLQAVNIEACFLGTAQENMGQVKRDMLNGKYRVVYITPEFASKASNVLQDLHSKVGIDLIAIDEAHCVSQWGHDFRSAYRSLGRIRDMLSKVPIVALTATATPEVRKDICKSLQLRNPVLTCTGFDRPNLFLSASNKSKSVAQDLRSMMTKQGNTYMFDGPTIIYCPTKKATMEVTSTLQASGVDCLPYHAGLSQAARKDAHKRFVNDKIQVIIATVAFGMGIDKPDVRRVIHYGAPKDIESYYQEMGRAGRDGMPGECHVFFANKDFLTCRYFINDITNATFKAHKLKMLSKMEQYLTLPSCRRRAILSHFENKAVTDVGGTNNCCDNCRKRIELGKRQNYYGASHQLQDPNEPVDFSKEALSLLGAIEKRKIELLETLVESDRAKPGKIGEGQRLSPACLAGPAFPQRRIEMALGGRFGIGVPVGLLVGSNNKKVAGYSRHSLYGKGRDNTQKWWQALGRQLLCEGYLADQRIQNAFGSTVELSHKGRLWYEQAKRSSNVTLKMLPSQDLRKPNKVEITLKSSPVPLVQSYPHKQADRRMTVPGGLAAKQVLPTVQVPSTPPKPQVDPRVAKLQNALYTKLVKQRNELSQETGFLPHSIASNKVLIDMAKVRPGSLEIMKKLEDMSEARVEKFGQQFLEIILPFAKENDVPLDDFPEKFNLEKATAESQQALVMLSETQQVSYIMFEQQGKSLEEVASLRGLKVSTVVTHLCEGLRVGLDIDIAKLGMTDKIRELVTQAVRAPPVSSDITMLTKIKDQLPLHVDWHHLKVVLALLEREHGVTVLPTGQRILHGATASSVSPHETGASVTVINNNNITTPLKLSSTHSTVTTGHTPYSSVQVHSRNSPFSSSFHSRISSTQEQTFSQSESQDSQGQLQSSKRKLPSWMSGGQAPKLSKKMKSNSLFR